MRTLNYLAAATIAVAACASPKIKPEISDRSSAVHSSIEGALESPESDALYLAIERDGKQYRLVPGTRLRKGDLLGLFYSAEKPGYLMVFHFDEEKDSELVYPGKGEYSEQIKQGFELPLPDGIELVGEVKPGCHWFIAVFSEQPLSVESVKNIIPSLKNKPATDDIAENMANALKCELEAAAVPGARSVKIFSYNR